MSTFFADIKIFFKKIIKYSINLIDIKPFFMLKLCLLYVEKEYLSINISDLIINVATLFIMMVPGVILQKCKLCSGSFGKGISNLVLYIAQHCLIVYAYLSCNAKFSDIWLGCLMTFILSFVAHGIFAAVAIPVFKKTPDASCRMLRFATIFSNAAFMGIPLIQAYPKGAELL